MSERQATCSYWVRVGHHQEAFEIREMHIGTGSMACWASWWLWKSDFEGVGFYLDWLAVMTTPFDSGWNFWVGVQYNGDGSSWSRRNDMPSTNQHILNTTQHYSLSIWCYSILTQCYLTLTQCCSTPTQCYSMLLYPHIWLKCHMSQYHLFVWNFTLVKGHWHDIWIHLKSCKNHSKFNQIKLQFSPRKLWIILLNN
jgi:hypothetical protein